ncbi:hypothetical protein PHJA_002438400 [Phtheirospermum japonicum]|uniref:DUF569 domain-containing protein n=1 Tax=Phtheirospermum japonicum TaxID=374723 RepID=A0A830D739_9LAMI|nr:hypothetical protein PHJA_002438400 [Phtheirospermum japonicum]
MEHKSRWTVEFMHGKHDIICLMSTHGLYPIAVEEPFLLAMMREKILQTLPEKMMDGTVEWEPVKEGLNVKLMTSSEKFLRANGAAPPWRISIMHNVPQWMATQSWVLWVVDIIVISVSDGPSSCPKSDCSSPASRSIFSSFANDYLCSRGGVVILPHQLLFLFSSKCIFTYLILY